MKSHLQRLAKRHPKQMCETCVTCENISGFSRGAATNKVHGSFLDAVHGNDSEDICISVAVSDNPFSLGVLKLSDMLFKSASEIVDYLHPPCSKS